MAPCTLVLKGGNKSTEIQVNWFTNFGPDLNDACAAGRLERLRFFGKTLEGIVKRVIRRALIQLSVNKSEL